MIPSLLAIPFLPLLAFVVNLAWGRRFGKAAGWISFLFMAASFGLSLSLLPGVTPQTHLVVTWGWLGPVRSGLSLGVVFDSLAEMMLLVVTFVSAMVQLYSIGYMADDERFHHFFSQISLFTFSMLGLVLAPNLLEMFMFWELVGLSSYLLIGFWFHKPEAASAAKKAFIVTRVGDFGFLIGILILFAATGTLDFGHLGSLAAAGRIAAPVLTAGAILVFAGAVGKSAQFPLHVWLPDAMEGPTPVSALIHAATMVAAGVYLVARAYPIFAHSPTALETVAWIGGFTAVFAASIGLLQYDIKRVIAYSTVSQLGYMMLGLGVGAYSAGVFHLMNHAFFKALLFLTAGSVIHSTGTQDLREMGGLGKPMKITMLTFLAGALSLAGIFPFSGFWSKDYIIEATQKSGHTVLWVFALLGAFFTAFYIFRVFFMTFTGKSRLPAGGHGHGHGGVHESPPVMTIPLILLGLLALGSAFIGLPFTGSIFQHYIFFKNVVPNVLDQSGIIISLSIAVLAILLSYLFYGARVLSPGKVARAFPGLYNLVYNKYYFDELYALVFVRPSLALARGFLALDRFVIDGIVNAVAFIAKEIGHGLKYLESGRVQTYAVMTFIGLVVIILTVTGGRI